MGEDRFEAEVVEFFLLEVEEEFYLLEDGEKFCLCEQGIAIVLLDHGEVEGFYHEVIVG